MAVTFLNENTSFGRESGAGMLRNKCAFTSRDMAADWPEAFTYAIVYGWSGAWEQIAAKHQWDDELVSFLKKAHKDFKKLTDKKEDTDA